MNKIEAAFKNKKLFIPYITLGDPTLEKTKDFILLLQKSGAGLIELGIPFSDPIAEGEVIQRANERALKQNINLDKIFTMLESIKAQVKVPLVFLTYINPLHHYGYDKFFKRCADTGVSGIITPDLPFEEHAEILEHAKKYGVDIITLVSPTSSAERIKNIADAASGYIYLVSSMGVTGVRSEITTDISKITSEIKKHTKVPVAVGFGISTPQQVKLYAQIADGVIVGSAIVKLVEQYGTAADSHIEQYVKEMASALN
jgi:tryptophan synthase alpha chain